MKAFSFILVLLIVIVSCGYTSKNPPSFKIVDLETLKDYNEYKRWDDGDGCRLMYFSKVKDSRLIDEAHVFALGEMNYKIDSRKLGIRVWNDTVYYYLINRDHTQAGWREKIGGGIFATDKPANFDSRRLNKYYNVVLKYENDSLIQTHVNSEVKNVWKLPEGLFYIAEPGLGVVQSEHIAQLKKRLKKNLE